MSLYDVFCDANNTTPLITYIAITSSVLAILILALLISVSVLSVKYQNERSYAMDARDDADQYEKQMDLILTYMAWERLNRQPAVPDSLPAVTQQSTKSYKSLCSDENIQNTKAICQHDILLFYRLELPPKVKAIVKAVSQKSKEEKVTQSTARVFAESLASLSEFSAGENSENSNKKHSENRKSKRKSNGSSKKDKKNQNQSFNDKVDMKETTAEQIKLEQISEVEQHQPQ